MRTSHACAAVLALTSLAAVPVLAQPSVGAEFRVNTYTGGNQVMAHVSVDPVGNFVVVWAGPSSTGGLLGQRFDPLGARRGNEFVVPDDPTSFVLMPQVAMDGNGGFIVVWASQPSAVPPPFEFDVLARLYDADGVPRGPSFPVHTSTAGNQWIPAVAAHPTGAFVVAWTDSLRDGDFDAVVAQRFDAAGNRLGAEFVVNTTTTASQGVPSVAMDAAGNFVVAWASFLDYGIYGQRFTAAGARIGGEFRVDLSTSTSRRSYPSLAMAAGGEFVVVWPEVGTGPGPVLGRRFDAAGTPMGSNLLVSANALGGVVRMGADGRFVVAWTDVGGDGSGQSVMARRFEADGAPQGAAFRVNASTTTDQFGVTLGSDRAGNLVATWLSSHEGTLDVFAQRYGGLAPAALSVVDGENGVLDVPDDFSLRTAWRNASGQARTFQGRASDFDVPAGLLLNLSADADYGTVPSGSTGTCAAPCYSGALLGTRPAGHVDMHFTERLLPDALGQSQRWTLHVGGSFTDVLRSNSFYPFVETLMHHGVTSGCSAARYCPAASTTREQMAVFVLVAKEGAGYVPPACTTPVFGDVPASSPFCRWIEDLARRGVTGGCGNGNYCPTAAVSREQMAVFVLRTLDPTLEPPACEPPNLFDDVPETSGFCRWIEELVRRGVVAGCAPQRYCPTDPVTREQMAVFLAGTFGLTLYGP